MRMHLPGTGRSRGLSGCLGVLMIAGAALISPANVLAAADDNFVKSLDLDLTSGVVHIFSSDGETYDSIDNADVAFAARIGIELRWPGAIDAIGIHLGKCTGHHGECLTMPFIFAEVPRARDFSANRSFTKPAGLLMTIETWLAALAICNNHASDAMGAGGDIIDLLDVGATLAVDTRRDLGKVDMVEGGDPVFRTPFGINEYSKTKSFAFKLPIACAPLPSKIEAAPKPKSVDIRVSQKGETCPKDTEVTAFIDYEKPMTARFRVIHNGRRSEPIEITARKVSLAGKTWYRIERRERYKLDPGRHVFQIKVAGGGKSAVKRLDIDCPPFKATSAWLSYDVESKDTCPKQVIERATIHANRPGDVPYRIKTAGGLVVAQGVAYAAREGDIYVARQSRKVTMSSFDQMMRLEIDNDRTANDQKPLKVECLEVLSGTLDLRDFAAGACEGEAAIAVRANGPGEVPYRLDCTGGKSWERRAKVVRTGPGTFMGVDRMRFGVTHQEQVNCALKTGKPAKVLALQGRQYQCDKPGGTSASAP